MVLRGYLFGRKATNANRKKIAPESWVKLQFWKVSHFFFFLAASGLSCIMRDLLLWHVGFSLQLWHGLSSCDVLALQLWHMGSRARGLCSCGSRAQQLRRRGLVALQHVGSQFPDQGSNPNPLHWKVDSQPLDHQGSPSHLIFMTTLCGRHYSYPCFIDEKIETQRNYITCPNSHSL